MKNSISPLFHTIFKVVLILAIAFGVAYCFPSEVNLRWGGVLTFKPIGYLILFGLWIMPNYYLLANKILIYKNIFYVICINIFMWGILQFADIVALEFLTFIIGGTFIVYQIIGKLRLRFSRRLCLGSGNIRRDIIVSIFIVFSTAIFSFGIVVVPAILVVLIFTILERKKLFGKMEGSPIENKYIPGELFVASLALTVFQLTIIIGYFIFFFE